MFATPSSVYITTGSTDLDMFLGGGIKMGSITEISGEPMSGKTHLCETLAITSQLPLNMNGGNGKCLYIDTEGTFRPEIVCAVGERYGLNSLEALNNVAYAKAYSFNQQTTLLNEAAAVMSQTKFATVIIDSYYTGMGEAVSTMQLQIFRNQLQHMANIYGVAVVITNKDWMGGNSEHIYQHNPASNMRLNFRRGHEGTGFCQLYQPNRFLLPHCTFAIKSDGVRDVMY